MRFTLQGFDENGNDILDGQETVNLYEEFEQVTIIADPDFIADAKRSWADSEMDGDKTTCTKAEFVQFFLRIVSSSFVSFAEKRG